MTSKQACSEYGWLVRKVAQEFLAFGIEIDDLVQEGMIGLCRAADQWKEDGGSKFESWAVLRIVDALRAFLTKERNRGMTDFPDHENPNAADLGYDVVDDLPEDLFASAAPSPEEVCARHEEIDAVRKALGQLPLETRDLLSQWASPDADTRGNTRAMVRDGEVARTTLQRRLASAQHELRRTVAPLVDQIAKVAS